MSKKKVPKEARDVFREAYLNATAKAQDFFREAGRVGGLKGAGQMTPEARKARAKKAAAASAKARYVAKQERTAKEPN